VSARGPGTGGGEGGVPVTVGGGGSCYFAYHIRKVGPENARPNTDFTYKIFVRNIGNCDLRHIRISDLLPERTHFVSSNPAPTETHDHKLIWDDVNLHQDERAVIEVRVKADDCDHHERYSITNTGCAYTPWIGTRICDTASTWIREDWSPVPPTSVIE